MLPGGGTVPLKPFMAGGARRAWKVAAQMSSSLPYEERDGESKTPQCDRGRGRGRVLLRSVVAAR